MKVASARMAGHFCSPAGPDHGTIIASPSHLRCSTALLIVFVAIQHGCSRILNLFWPRDCHTETSECTFANCTCSHTSATIVSTRTVSPRSHVWPGWKSATSPTMEPKASATPKAVIRCRLRFQRRLSPEFVFLQAEKRFPQDIHHHGLLKSVRDFAEVVCDDLDLLMLPFMAKA